jgi:hypothetical protein
MNVESEGLIAQNAVCPVCACSLDDDAELQVCDTCETPHHKDCWDYTGGCAIFGCRKGVLRKFEDDRRRNHFLTTFSLKLMSLWGKLIYCDLVFFLLCGYSLLLLLLGGQLAMAMSIFVKFFYSLPLVEGLFTVLWSIMGLLTIPIFLTLAVGSLGLCLTWLPDKVMRIHFWMVSISVSAKKMDSACQIASRVELPHTFVDFGRRVHETGKKLTLIVSKLVLVISVLTLIPVFPTLEFSAVLMGGILNCAFLTFLYYNCIPATQVEMERRLTFITAFQNRLIASAKASKGH